ncbi:MAG: response regulator transcription factor [Alphaproteobacteria bacterium]|nr:response regulator transcription factor [Alphaproteobacteria bacterium]
MSVIRRIVVQSVFPLERAGVTGLVRSLWASADIREGATLEALETGGALLRDPACAPDLVIVDWRTPEQATTVVRGLADGHSAIIVALTDDGSLGCVRRAVTMGASAVVDVNTAPDVLKAILSFAAEGGDYVPVSVLGDLSAGPGGVRPLSTSGYSGGASGGVVVDDPAFAHLTRRQREVLKLVSRGLSNEEIALEMGVTLNTVKSHVSSMLRALGVKRRTQAMRLMTDTAYA